MVASKVKRTEVTTPVRIRVIGFWEATNNAAKAGRRVGLTPRRSQRIIKRWKETGSASRAPRSGRPKLLSKREERSVVRTARNNRRAPLQLLANKTPSQPSAKTIKRTLERYGYHRRVALRRPYLRRDQKRARLQWARRYRRWTRRMWRRVIWSDECYIYMDDRKGRVYVTRRPDEVFLQDCLIPSITQSSVRVMVWGAIMDGVKGPLVVLEYPGGKGGGMNSARYREQVLNGVLKEWYNEMTVKRGHVYFQQDGAPSHTSKSTKQWFKENGIKLFPHPSCSPDISPIEPVWHELKSIVRRLP